MLQLIQREGEQFIVLDKQHVSIGRDTSNDLILEDPNTSGFHAAIFVENRNVEIVDLGSTNGTLINGKPINGRERIKAWDRVTFGTTEFEVVDSDGRRPTRVQPIVEQQINNVHMMSRQQEIQPAIGKLQLITKGDYPSVIYIPKEPYARVVIGREGLREQQGDGASAYNLHAPTVSARHAEIIFGKEGIEIVDLGSANGTFVNNQKIQHCYLKQGDRIRFDEIEYLLEIDGIQLDQMHIKPTMVPGENVVHCEAQAAQMEEIKSPENVDTERSGNEGELSKRGVQHDMHFPVELVLADSVPARRGVSIKTHITAPIFVLLYILFMLPTYYLPYVGSNSALVGAITHSTPEQSVHAVHFLLHAGALGILIFLAAIRGSAISKGWLSIFPILAAVFDLVPGINLIPLVPTVMHLCAIIQGVANVKQIEAAIST